MATSGTGLRAPAIGQSYVLAEGTASEWVDYAISRGENLFINAYTDDVEKDEAADKKKTEMKLITAGIENLALPEKVKGVRAVFADTTSVTLTWDKKGSTDYVVCRYNSEAKTWSNVGFTEQNYWKKSVAAFRLRLLMNKSRLQQNNPAGFFLPGFLYIIST